MIRAAEIAVKSDIGKHRPKNEDSFGYDQSAGVYVVCDGMGGEAAGEVASHLAVQVILDHFRQAKATSEPDSSATTKELAAAIVTANHKIFSVGAENAAQQGMGSTVVATLVTGRSVTIANVGDSRVYLFRGGALKQLTDDHSLVMEQYRHGVISLAEALNSPLQHIITRALGTEAEVEVDVQDFPAKNGDVLLLCSDGLTRHLDDSKITEVLTSSSTLEIACDRLIQESLDDGGLDNITCLLLRVSDEDQPSDNQAGEFSRGSRDAKSLCKA